MKILDAKTFINEWYINSTLEYMPKPQRNIYQEDESIDKLCNELTDNSMIILMEGKYFNPYKKITQNLIDFINYHPDSFFTDLREALLYIKDGGRIIMMPDSCIRSDKEVAILKRLSDDLNKYGVKFIIIHNDYGNKRINKIDFEAIKRRSYIYSIGGSFFDNIDALLGRR